MRWIVLKLLLALAPALASATALANVWGFVDDKGTAHFASERVDERYELYFRSGESFDTANGVKPTALIESSILQTSKPLSSSLNSPLVSPTVNPKLLAFFDVSPSYKQVKHHIKEASTSHNIDYELLQALIVAESGFDSAAVSPKGAVGLMQLMPATAQRYGVKGDVKTPLELKLTDPKTNIRAGSAYLRDLIKMFPGSIELALAAYNAGEGAVQRAGNKIPNYPETQKYVKTVMGLYGALKPPSQLIERRNPLAATPGRVRMEISAAGIPGRRNMVPLTATVPGPGGQKLIAPTIPMPMVALPDFKIERD